MNKLGSDADVVRQYTSKGRWGLSLVALALVQAPRIVAVVIVGAAMMRGHV